MTQMTTKPLSFFKTDPNQPRKLFDEADLLSLGTSMKTIGQLQPVGAKPDGIMLWGGRRHKAAQRVGLKELSVIITDRPLSDSEIRLIQLTENMHRADLTGYEMWQACKELLELNPSWQGKDLAEHLHRDPSIVPRLLSPSKIVPEAVEALRQGKIGISDCYSLSKASTEDQLGLLALKLSGASRDELEQAGRKKRSAATPAVRASKIKCQLGSGVSIVVTGTKMTLDEMIESLLEAMKEAKKARDQGLNVETFQRVMRDRARAN